MPTGDKGALVSFCFLMSYYGQLQDGEGGGLPADVEDLAFGYPKLSIVCCRWTSLNPCGS